MSKRDLRLYFDDILESIEAIEDYLTHINSFEDFARDRKTYSATIREYIVIGEAVGRLMEVLEDRHPDYDWRMIKDFRNFIVHEYFGVDLQIIWDITKFELNVLKLKISGLRREYPSL